jgi:hypothetical protein
MCGFDFGQCRGEELVHTFLLSHMSRVMACGLMVLIVVYTDLYWTSLVTLGCSAILLGTLGDLLRWW